MGKFLLLAIKENLVIHVVLESKSYTHFHCLDSYHSRNSKPLKDYCVSLMHYTKLPSNYLILMAMEWYHLVSELISVMDVILKRMFLCLFFC